MSIRQEVSKKATQLAPKPWYLTVQDGTMHGRDSTKIYLSWTDGRYLEMEVADNLKLKDTEVAELFGKKLQSYLEGKSE